MKLYRKFKSLFDGLPKRMRFKGAASNVEGLEKLARKYLSGKRGLEIGSFAGESALIMMECGVVSLHCVDLWAVNGYYHEAKISPAYESFKRIAGRYPGAVVACQGSSNVVLTMLAQREAKFDFVYIDGDHKYDSVCQDIALAIAVLKPGGLLCGHDYGRVVQKDDVTKAVNDMLGVPDKRFVDSSWMKKI